MEAAAADASPRESGSPRAGGGSCRRSRPWSRSSSIGRSGSSSCGSGSIEYTSLRDVMEEECGGWGDHHDSGSAHWWGGSGSGWGDHSCHDIHDFDASNIGIRNQLLKHAASAYLQSAVVVATGRDQGCCLARLWRRLQLRSGCAGTPGGGFGGRRGRGGRGRVLMGACSWQGCVDDPAELCATFVARSARRIAAFVTDRVNAIWAW